MIDFFLFILANIILTILGFLSIQYYKSFSDFSPWEQALFSFITGIFLNFVIFFIASWGGFGLNWIIPLYFFVIIVMGWLHIRKSWWKNPLKHFHLPKREKPFQAKNLIVVWLGTLIAFRFIFSLFQSVYLPSYFDDEKWNWTLKSKSIYYEWWLWFDSSIPETYLWGGWHKEYPLGWVLYKVYITKFIGWWDDSIINLIHPIFAYWVIFLIVFWLIQGYVARLTILYIITSLPLFSWHAGVAYFDLFVGILLALIFYNFLKFFETKNKAYLFIIPWIVSLVINTKNEWIVLVLPALLPLFYLVTKEKIFTHAKEWLLLFAPLILSLPHVLFRIIYHLPLNPTSAVAKYGWHADAPGLLYDYFFRWWSYNIFWYVLVCILSVIFISKKYQIQKEERILLISLGILFSLILAVFFFTNNYQFLLDQTTIHRTMLIFMVPATIVIGKIYSANYFKD